MGESERPREAPASRGRSVFPPLTTHHLLPWAYAAIFPSGIHTGDTPREALTQKKRAGGKPLTPISSESPVRTGIFSPRSTTASVNVSDSTTPACRTDSGPELIAN